MTIYQCVHRQCNHGYYAVWDSAGSKWQSRIYDTYEQAEQAFKDWLIKKGCVIK